MSILYTIIIYLVAFFIGGVISCFPYIKKLRGILLPISSVACVAFIEIYGKELQDSELAQYAAVGILFFFAFSRITLLGKKNLNRYSEYEYKSLVNTCYMASYAVIIFLMIIYTGYFNWLFGTTSKVMIIFSAIALIGITLDERKINKRMQ